MIVKINILDFVLGACLLYKNLSETAKIVQ
jgi:hypothetical protein